MFSPLGQVGSLDSGDVPGRRELPASARLKARVRAVARINTGQHRIERSHAISGQQRTRSNRTSSRAFRAREARRARLPEGAHVGVAGSPLELLELDLKIGPSGRRTSSSSTAGASSCPPRACASVSRSYHGGNMVRIGLGVSRGRCASDGEGRMRHGPDRDCVTSPPRRTVLAANLPSVRAERPARVQPMLLGAGLETRWRYRAPRRMPPPASGAL